MSGLAVRRIAATDGALLRSLRLASLRDMPGAYATRLADAEALTDDRWEQIAAAHASGSSQAIWFAERDGDLAGMLAAFRTLDDVVTLTSLWASPGHRRIGVADTLMEVATTWAAQHDGRCLRLWIVESNHGARDFYVALGFRPTGATMGYEPDPRQVELEYRKDL